MAPDVSSDIVFTTRASATPWNISGGIAALFAAVMVAGIVWSLIEGNALMFIGALVLLIVSGLMLRYALVRRARRAVLELRADRVDLIYPAAGGGTTDRRSGVDWADVDSLVTVQWRGWPWLAVRCRPGQAPDGSAWHRFDAHGVYALTTLSAWGVTPDRLRTAIRAASGLDWRDELRVDDHGR